MTKTCNHPKDDIIDITKDIRWCRECGALRFGTLGKKARWHTPTQFRLRMEQYNTDEAYTRGVLDTQERIRRELGIEENEEEEK